MTHEFEQAAQQATGEPAEGLQTDQQTEALDSGGVLDRLFDGSAEGPDVRQLQQEYNLQQWMALILRGVLRAAPGRGMPPIGDISLGGLLGVRHYQLKQQEATEPAESRTEPSEAAQSAREAGIND